MELKSYLLDWRLKDRDEKDLDNFEAVVPRVDKAGVPQESNSFSSNRGVIGEPIATFTPKLYMFMMEPIATSTPKAFTEHALNQDRTETVLGKHQLIYMYRENEHLNHTVSCCKMIFVLTLT